MEKGLKFQVMESIQVIENTENEVLLRPRSM